MLVVFWRVRDPIIPGGYAVQWHCKLTYVIRTAPGRHHCNEQQPMQSYYLQFLFQMSPDYSSNSQFSDGPSQHPQPFTLGFSVALRWGLLGYGPGSPLHPSPQVDSSLFASFPFYRRSFWCSAYVLGVLGAARWHHWSARVKWNSLQMSLQKLTFIRQTGLILSAFFFASKCGS